MAYSTIGTMTWYNVVVPVAGTYLVKFRYAFDFGLFPGITDRPEAILLNGIVVDKNMHFIRTGSFSTFCHSAINVHLVVKFKRKSPTPRESFQSLARQSKGSKRLILSTRFRPKRNSDGNFSAYGLSRVDDMTVGPTNGAITPVNGLPAPTSPTECNNLP
jgi:hypothetical protein